MKSILLLLKNHIGIVVVLALCLLTRWRWFFTLNPITGGDAGYYYNSRLSELFNELIWNTATQFGSLSPMPNFYPVNLVTSIFSIIIKIIGLDAHAIDITQRLIIFCTFSLISFVYSYKLSHSLFKNQFSALLSSVIYNLNTYYLISFSSHVTLAVAYSIFPAALFYLNRLLVKKDIPNLILLILALFLIGTYEIRSLYVFILILLVFFLFTSFFKIKSTSFLYYKYYIFILPAILLFLNLFWVIPVYFGDLYGGYQGVVINRAIFQSPEPPEGLLIPALTLFHPYWSGSLLISFAFSSTPIVQFVIPLFLLFFLIVLPLNKYPPIIKLILVVYVLGIMLSKFLTPPFVGLYGFLYNHLPGFNVFREPSKFPVIIYLSFSLLAGYFFSNLKLDWAGIKLKRTLFLSYFILFYVFAINVFPLINGSAGRTYANREIPKDYLIFENKVIANKRYFRTFWLPSFSRWSEHSNLHPKISANDSRNAEWKNIYDIFQNTSFEGVLTGIFNKPYSNQRFDNSSIKYVIVPIQDTANDDDFFVYYGGQDNPNIRDWYIEQLDQVPWLKKIDIGTKELVVYENEGYYPHIYTSDYNVYSTWQMSTLLNFFDLDTDIKTNLYTASKKPGSESLHEKESFKAIAPMMDEILIEAKLENLAKDEELASYRAEIVRELPEAFADFNTNIYKAVQLKDNFELWRLRYKPEALLKQYLLETNKEIALIKKYGIKSVDQLDLIRDYSTKVVDQFALMSASPSSVPSVNSDSVLLKLLATVEQTFDYQRSILNSLNFGGSTDETVNKIFDEARERLSKYRPAHSFNTLTYNFSIPVEGDYDLFLRNKKYVEESIDFTTKSTEASASSVLSVIPTSVPSGLVPSVTPVSVLSDPTDILKWKSEEWIPLGTETYNEGENEYVIPNPEVGENLLASDLSINEYQSDTIYKISLTYKASEKKGSVSVNEGSKGAVFTAPLNKTFLDTGTFETYFKSSAEGRNAYVIASADTVENIKVEQVRQEEIVLRYRAKERSVSGLPSEALAKLGGQWSVERRENQPNISFQFINPTKYRISVTGARDPFTLTFSESYHPGWKLFLADKPAVDVQETVMEYFGGQVKEKKALQQFDRNFKETWKLQSIADETHLTANGFANSWYIKPEDVGNQQNYELILEFTPQKYFYIGGVISLTTLILLLIALPITIVVEKKAQRKTESTELITKSTEL